MVPGLVPLTVVWDFESSCLSYVKILTAYPRTGFRHWTAAEDELVRRRAVVGWPTLKKLAVDLGRTHWSLLTRASRLGAIRVRPCSEPRAARTIEKKPCSYCGFLCLLTGGARYCGGACRALARRQCPGCGSPMGTGMHCSHCAVVGKRSDWPERAARPVHTD